ncbi:MAG TPA: DUF3566 domain-containing protein [Micromonosporaceae bacterium]|nr:DUF3566 domain-containing protein [Micromonosporaceae bacterium]
MTETQAKSGTAEAPANPVDEEGADPSATGRTAVGRATVPADAAPPKYTRAPGMAPPPDKPSTDQGSGATEPAGSGSVAAVPPTTATAPAEPMAASMTPLGSPVSSSPTAAANPAVGGADGQVGAPPPAVPRIPAVGAARVADAVRAARSSAASRGPRRARLNIKRIDPWSVMKFSFAVSFVLFIVVIVATSVLYLALDAMGVFEKVNGTITEMISTGGGQQAGSFKITASGVIGSSALLGLVNVVLFTALATLGAFIYNVCADLVGGIEVTLAERD